MSMKEKIVMEIIEVFFEYFGIILILVENEYLLRIVWLIVSEL